MAADEKVIDKIRKMLALAGNNPNEHEAAAAAAKAQELMLGYDLTVEAVSTKMDRRLTGIERGERREMRKHGKPGTWKFALFSVIGSTSGCWVYGGEHSAYLIGRAQDVELAHYLFDYLSAELERLQQEYGNTRWAELREYAKFHGISTHEAETDFSGMGRHPLRAKQSWIRGAAEVVISTLHREHYERRHRDEATSALMVNKEAAIQDWWAQQRGYADWADYQAKTRSAVVPVEDTRTPAQKKRDEERDRKYWERQERKERTARRNQDKATDWEAYEDGRETGKGITIRRGVKAGETPEERKALR